MGEAREQHLVGARRQRDAAAQHGVEEAGVDAVSPPPGRHVVGRRVEWPVPGPAPRTDPTSGPTAGAATASPAPAMADSSRRRTRDACARAPRSRRRLTSSSTARPAAVASGFPDSVPAWYTGPTGASCGQQLPAAAERADRQPAADHLAEAPQVRGHAEPRRRAARAEAEARDDLVEDQQRPGRVARGPQALEEPGAGGDQVHVGGHRLDDDAGHVARRARVRRCRARPSVSATAPAGTPAEPGSPSMATPLPRRPAAPSEWPW